MKNRLVELLYEAEGQINNDIPSPEQIADYLLSHGVIVQVQSNTPKTYFTPQEVRKMSREEVRENYTAIFNSMKKWY